MRKYRFFFYYYYYYFFFFGGGGGSFVNCQVLKLAANHRYKFRYTHWPDKSLTIVEDKPWK